MLMSTTITKISTALLAAQKSMGGAKKDSSNPFFRSSYADLNSIRAAVLPSLNEQGITVLQPTVVVDGKNYVRTLLLHESGEYLASDTEIVQSKQNDPQAHGSGISYARRYSLQSMLNVAALDDDGEGSMDRTSNRSTVKTTTTAATTAPVVTGQALATPSTSQASSGGDTSTASLSDAAESPRRRPSSFKVPKQVSTGVSTGGFE